MLGALLTTILLGLVFYGLFYTIVLCFVDCDVQLAFYEKFGKSVRRLKGKVVFITGASSGIGEHTAITFAKHGVKLVLTARRRDELERVKRNCLAVSKGLLTDDDVLVLPMDMLDIQSHKTYFDRAVRHFGGVDILVNNAGKSQRAFWENIELHVDREMFELNVFSVINLSRIAIKYFLKRGHGHIAVTSSMAGIIGVPYSASYTGSKHAIHGYFNSLRTEMLGKNIPVTLLCPGPVFTNFLSEALTEKQGEKYGISTQPTDKRMTGERCGELCAIAIVNKASEAWMSIFPLLHFAYIAVCFPLVYKCFLKVAGAETLFKLRDSRNTTVLTEEKRTM